MSVIDITEDFTGLSAGDQMEPEGKISGTGTRYFDVQFDENDPAFSRPFMAKADGRIPQLGEGHPYNPWIYVINRQAVVMDKSPFLYRVIVQYAEIENPLDQIPIIEWLTSSTSEVITTDYEDKAIENSAGEPVDPPHVLDVEDLVLRATWNVVVFNALGASKYNNVSNSDTFLGYQPGQAKVMSYTGREIKAITGYKYVEATVEIHFRTRPVSGWKRRFPDEGFRTKNEAGEITEITDEGGKRISEPVKLDGSGQILADGLDPVLRDYWAKEPLPFTTEFGFLAGII